MSSSTLSPRLRPPATPPIDEEEPSLEEEAPATATSTPIRPTPARDTRLGRLLFFGVSVFLVWLVCGVLLQISAVMWDNFGTARFNAPATSVVVPADLEVVTVGEVIEIDPGIPGCVVKQFPISANLLPDKLGGWVKIWVDQGTPCEFTVTIWIVPPPAESEK